jgi:lysozyme
MNRIIAISSAVIFIALVALIFFELGYVRFNYPSVRTYPVQGIDISHHQDAIDWHVLERSDIAFAFITATEGGDHKDTKFEENWERAGRIGLVRGAYHFFTFCKSGREQALNFIETVPLEKVMLPPAIDLEFSGNCQARPTKEELHKELRDFTELVQKKYGRRLVLYITNESYEAFVRGEDLPYYIWIRDIYSKPNLAQGQEWTFWQYAHRGRLHGIKGFVDLNAFNGTREYFKEVTLPRLGY